MENAILKTNHPSDPWITARTCVYQYNDVTILNRVTGYSILWAPAERSKVLDLEGFFYGKWRTGVRQTQTVNLETGRETLL